MACLKIRLGSNLEWIVPSPTVPARRPQSLKSPNIILHEQQHVQEPQCSFPNRNAKKVVSTTLRVATIVKTTSHATKYSSIHHSPPCFPSTSPRPTAACLEGMIRGLKERICSVHRFQDNTETHAILILCRVEAESVQAIPIVEQAD